jgi:hypothetical protein
VSSKKRALSGLFYLGQLLDFLGFSRQKLAVSMGYAGFSLKEISRALSPARQNLGTAAHDFGPRKGTDWSWGKGNPLSAFLQ